MKNKFSYSIIAFIALISVILTEGCKKTTESPYVDKGYLVFTGDGSFKQMMPLVSDTLKGTAKFVGVYDNNSKNFNYKLSWSKLSTTMTTARFYGPAVVGQIGITLRDITTLQVRPVTDSLTGVIWAYSKLSDIELANLKNGKWYYTISTQLNTGGEVRGQITYQRTFYSK